MEFKRLLEQIDYLKIKGVAPKEINKVTDSSKDVEKSSLFICVNGCNVKGIDFIREARQRGCSVIVSQEEVETDLCLVLVEDVKRAVSQIAKAFYGNPQEDLRVVGVVGTNGKTTVCHVLSKMLSSGGYEVGITGTIGTYYKGKQYDTKLTTPGCLNLYKLIREMADDGVEVLVMEVSAHAIDQRRIEGISFHSLIFTNCTEDHLDYFEDFERYKLTKKSVFTSGVSKYMIVNSDDQAGREILSTADGKIITYGIENPADVFAIDVNESAGGIEYVINLCDAIYDIKSNLIGRVNVYNTLACSACSAAFGINIHTIAKSLLNIPPVEGRAEPIASVRGCLVFIDYAHTPDGLRQTLTSMKKICKGRLFCLFGCGGNREKQKRSVMGKISGSIADFTVITDDNPRYEDECAIIKQIEEGVMSVTHNYITIKDRRSAIQYALDKVGKNDVLLIAGKGAEKYQEILGERRYFSDKDEVLSYLSLTEA